MLGLKREIIKERDAAGDAGEGGTRDILHEVMQTGVAWTCSWLSFPLRQQEVRLLRRKITIRAVTMSYKTHLNLVKLKLNYKDFFLTLTLRLQLIYFSRAT